MSIKCLELKKKTEKVEQIKPVQKTTKKKDKGKVDVEIVRDKISIFNELDNIF